MFKFGLRTVSQLFLGSASNASKCVLPVQTSAVNILKPTASPGRTIFTLPLNSVMPALASRCILQSSSVLTESRRNQGSSRVSHYKPMTRNLLKFTYKKGKPRTERVVLLKFYRLNWGGWIRTMTGRARKVYYKSTANKKRSQRHVFCNAKQCTLLDKMTTEYWKKPKHYVDDPYEPYHTREEFRYTRQKPREFIFPE